MRHQKSSSFNWSFFQLYGCKYFLRTAFQAHPSHLIFLGTFVFFEWIWKGTGENNIEVLRTLGSLYQVMDSRTSQILVLKRTDTSIVVFITLKMKMFKIIIEFISIWKKWNNTYSNPTKVINDFDEHIYFKKIQRFSKKNLKSEDYFVFKVEISYQKYWHFF